MNELLLRLRKNQRKGSKPRCHWMTHGSAAEVATRLTALVAPFAQVTPKDRWMPKGFLRPDEATLPEADLLSEAIRSELRRWWLAVATNYSRTPNWDIASTCQVVGTDRPGLLLVEAKAHDQELINEETGRKNIKAPVSASACRNHLRIGWCIQDASIALNTETGLLWALSRDWNYQMSNRFTWAWKLTELGVPVVLVYLGFLGASEMDKGGNPIADASAWEKLVTGHSRRLFPAEVWGRRLMCSGQPFVPLIRSIHVSLDGKVA